MSGNNSHATFTQGPEESGHWKVVIADDDQGVHDVTVLALKRFTFEDKPLNFYHAYTAAETCTLVERYPDIALILLDVVMDSDDAGLKAVQYIREQLKNSSVRIVLRTGQPGAAPEEEVIHRYDINDYKDKTELTTQKLKTVIYSSLRSFSELNRVEYERQGLSQLTQMIGQLFKHSSQQQLFAELPGYLSSIIKPGLALENSNPELASFIVLGNSEYALSSSGEFEQSVDQPITEFIEVDELKALMQAIEQQQPVFTESCSTLPFATKGEGGVVFIRHNGKLSDLKQELLQRMTENLTIACSNMVDSQ